MLVTRNNVLRWVEEPAFIRMFPHLLSYFERNKRLKAAYSPDCPKCNTREHMIALGEELLDVVRGLNPEQVKKLKAYSRCNKILVSLKHPLIGTKELL